MDKFVAFFDILGFKNLVEKNSHDELVKIYQEVLLDTVSEIKRIGLELHENDSTALKSLGSIKQFIISDSIILIQEDCTHRGLFFITVQAKVLLQMAIEEGIPLRGGISVGPVTILENFGTTIIGQGLVNAYTLETIQNWSGAIIDDKCFQIHPNDNIFLEELENRTPLFANYVVPTKIGNNQNYHVINWVKDNQTLEEIEEAFVKHGKEVISEKEKHLIANTLKFAEFCIAERTVFKQMRKAKEVFFFLMKNFEVSVQSVSSTALEKLLNPEKNDIISFLLESPLYSIEKKGKKSFLVHSLSKKKINIDEVLNFKNIESFEFYLKLSPENKLKVLKGLK